LSREGKAQKLWEKKREGKGSIPMKLGDQSIFLGGGDSSSDLRKGKRGDSNFRKKKGRKGFIAGKNQ